MSSRIFTTISLSKSLFKGESTRHVQLTISETIHQVFVTIHGPQLTPAIKELQRNIEALTNQQFINVFQDRSLIKLPLQSVSRFYTANKRLYCETTTGAYLVHSHLHTLMDQLPPSFRHYCGFWLVKFGHSAAGCSKLKRGRLRNKPLFIVCVLT